MIQNVTDMLFPRGEKAEQLIFLAKTHALRTLEQSEKRKESHVSLFSYKNPLVRELVWQIKYHHNQELINEIGSLFYEEIFALLSDSLLFEKNKKILLLPVPMSKNRRRERGYNQTEEITEAIITQDIAKILDYQKNILRKKEGVIPQTKTSEKKDRLKNIIDAFTISDPSLIKGRFVIIIDDVETTGATLGEIHRILERAGAAEVFSFTIAN